MHNKWVRRKPINNNSSSHCFSVYSSGKTLLPEIVRIVPVVLKWRSVACLTIRRTALVQENDTCSLKKRRHEEVKNLLCDGRLQNEITYPLVGCNSATSASRDREFRIKYCPLHLHPPHPPHPGRQMCCSPICAPRTPSPRWTKGPSEKWWSSPHIWVLGCF